MKPADDTILKKLVNNKYPNKGWGFHGSTRPISSLEGLKVNDVVTHNITIDDFNTLKKSELAEYDSQEYARTRATEYPNIGDQLDALYHAGVFPKEMSDKLKAVKDKYPKG